MCAMAVPKAMPKTINQLIEEIEVEAVGFRVQGLGFRNCGYASRASDFIVYSSGLGFRGWVSS